MAGFRSFVLTDTRKIRWDLVPYRYHRNEKTFLHRSRLRLYLLVEFISQYFLRVQSETPRGASGRSLVVPLHRRMLSDSASPCSVKQKRYSHRSRKSKLCPQRRVTNNEIGITDSGNKLVAKIGEKSNVVNTHFHKYYP